MPVTWKLRARSRGTVNYLSSPERQEALETFQRACELVLASRGIHGKGTLSTAEYPFNVKQFEGVWNTYRVDITEGEIIYYKDYQGYEKVSDAVRESETQVISIGTAQTLIEEMGIGLAPFHEGEPARWVAIGIGLTGKGLIKPIGEKQLSSTRSVLDATGQAVSYIDDWLTGIVYSSSDIGAVSSIWMAARLDI